MIIFIEKPEDALFSVASNTLVKKLSKEATPGAVIQLTTDEMSLMLSAHVVGVSSKPNPIELIEVDRDKKYIAVCDQSVNLDDLVRLIDSAKLAIRIVRTRND